MIEDRVAVVTVPALLKIATVAELLDCSPRTVRRRITDGELPAVSDHGCTKVRGDDLRRYVDTLQATGASVTSRSRPTRRARRWDR